MGRMRGPRRSTSPWDLLSLPSVASIFLLSSFFAAVLSDIAWSGGRNGSFPCTHSQKIPIPFFLWNVLPCGTGVFPFCDGVLFLKIFFFNSNNHVCGLLNRENYRDSPMVLFLTAIFRLCPLKSI